MPLPAGKEEGTEAQRGKQPAQCHTASEAPESTLGPFLSWALTSPLTWQSSVGLNSTNAEVTRRREAPLNVPEGPSISTEYIPVTEQIVEMCPRLGQWSLQNDGDRETPGMGWYTTGFLEGEEAHGP